MALLEGCFCFNLRVGTILIGILSLVLSSGQLLGTIYQLLTGFKDSYYFYDTSMGGFNHTQAGFLNPLNDVNGTGCYLHIDILEVYRNSNLTIRVPDLADMYDVDCLKLWMDHWVHMSHYGVSVAVMLVALLYLIVTVLLLHGVRKNNRSLFLPWVLWTALQLSILTALAVLAVIFTYYADLAAIFVIVAIACLLTAFMFLYFLLVVISYHQALGEPFKL